MRGVPVTGKAGRLINHQNIPAALRNRVAAFYVHDRTSAYPLTFEIQPWINKN